MKTSHLLTGSSSRPLHIGNIYTVANINVEWRFHDKNYPVLVVRHSG